MSINSDGRRYKDVLTASLVGWSDKVKAAWWSILDDPAISLPPEIVEEISYNLHHISFPVDYVIGLSSGPPITFAFDEAFLLLYIISKLLDSIGVIT